MEAGFQRKLAKVREPLDKLVASYRKRLGEIKATALEAGDLDLALLVAAEIEQSDGGGVPVSDVRGYPDLDSARRLYVKSYQPLSKREEQQIDGLLGEYGRALGVLEKTLTNDGRVADARSVRAVVEASGERRWRVVRQGSAGNGLVLHYAFDRRPA